MYNLNSTPVLNRKNKIKNKTKTKSRKYTKLISASTSTQKVVVIHTFNTYDDIVLFRSILNLLLLSLLHILINLSVGVESFGLYGILKSLAELTLRV